MPRYDFVILTDDHYVQQNSGGAWEEDELLRNALQNHGLSVTRKSWSDTEFDWSTADKAIFRTTWDYFHRAEEWKVWLEQVSGLTELINPIETVRWNMDKHYLRDLSQKGVNVPETLYIEPGEKTSLQKLHDQTGWEETILKPCIAGTARHTYRLNSGNLTDHESLFQELIASEAMMLQPFQKHILTEGELSLMVIGGQFTHAVIKRAKAGDFRVQDDFGGTKALVEATREQIAFAEQAVAACDQVPAYARVDIIKDNYGKQALIELELIEPELWFRFYPQAADALAKVLAKKD